MQTVLDLFKKDSENRTEFKLYSIFFSDSRELVVDIADSRNSHLFKEMVVKMLTKDFDSFQVVHGGLGYGGGGNSLVKVFGVLRFHGYVGHNDGTFGMNLQEPWISLNHITSITAYPPNY